MKYTIEIIEKLRYEEEIEADSVEDAIYIMQKKYRDEEIILMAEHLEETIIKEAEDAEMNYSYEHY